MKLDWVKYKGRGSTYYHAQVGSGFYQIFKNKNKIVLFFNGYGKVEKFPKVKSVKSAKNYAEAHQKTFSAVE